VEPGAAYEAGFDKVTRDPPLCWEDGGGNERASSERAGPATELGPGGLSALGHNYGDVFTANCRSH
jgi:hypothetical protein